MRRTGLAGAAVVALAGLLAACQGPVSPTQALLVPQPLTAAPTAIQPTSTPVAPTTAPSPTSTPTALPVVVTGPDSGNSKLFTLQPGDYTVTMHGNCTDKGGCAAFIGLVPKGDSTGYPDEISLINEVGNNKNGPYSYTNNVYGLAGGLYYLDDNAQDKWTLTFTAQP